MALLAMLAATAMLAQFFRTSTAILGPELIRDLDLSPEAFGLANASFFIALLLAQIPVGLAYDRFGPRLTVAALFVPMAAGAMLHGLADTGAQMAVARFVTGIGCAAGFTASVVLVSAWFSRAVMEHDAELADRAEPSRCGPGRHAAGRGHAADRLALHLRRHGPGGGADRLPVRSGRA